MKLKFCSEYNDFSMFLTEFKLGADAVVYDRDAGYCLCKVVDITENVNSAAGDYTAMFVIPDGDFFVGVDYVRSAESPNEFLPLVEEYLKDKSRFYC